jgi:uncharacterized membrane protein YfcA
MEFYLLLVLAGLAGGLLSGLLGVGGGLVYILILPFAFSYIGIPSQEIAQYTIANSLLGTFFAASLASANHIRSKEFHYKATFIISAIGIFMGLLTLKFIVNTPFYAQEEFNMVVVVLLLLMLISTLRNARRQVAFDERVIKTKRIFVLTGFFSGTVAALSGLGGGIIIIPFLNHIMRFDIRKAKSISLGVISITSICMVCYNLFQTPQYTVEIGHTGYVVFQVALPIILGTLISVNFGVRLSRKLSSKMISYLFAGFVLVVIIKKSIELI